MTAAMFPACGWTSDWNAAVLVFNVRRAKQKTFLHFFLSWNPVLNRLWTGAAGLAHQCLRCHSKCCGTTFVSMLQQLCRPGHIVCANLRLIRFKVVWKTDSKSRGTHLDVADGLGVGSGWTCSNALSHYKCTQVCIFMYQFTSNLRLRWCLATASLF